MARRMIRVPHVAMVNLLAGCAIVPELLQENCTPDMLSATVLSLLRTRQQPTHARHARRYRDPVASRGRSLPAAAAPTAYRPLPTQALPSIGAGAR